MLTIFPNNSGPEVLDFAELIASSAELFDNEEDLLLPADAL